MRFTTDQVFKRSAVGAGLKIDPASHDEAEANAEWGRRVEGSVSAHP